MVTHRSIKQKLTTPVFDEEWWAALLADEERLIAGANHRSRKEEAVPEGKVPVKEVLPVRKLTTNWDLAQRLYALDEAVSLTVSGFNRGGLLVDGDHLHGFVPVSHLVEIPCDLSEAERIQIMERYVGRSLTLKVIECDPDKGRIVFSERAALAQAGRRNQLMSELRPDTCVRGVVTNITDFGVFVDLGGVEGLIHVSEISWGRVNHPTDLLRVGQEITVYILQVDKERSRIALSLKRMCPNPWETAEQRYSPGQIVEVMITCVAPFGAFARLEEGLDGLIHVSEMNLVEGCNPADVFREGDRVKARILHIDASKQRLGLSLLPVQL